MAGTAAADQDDSRLEGLFAELKSVSEPAAGERITERIWSIWLESGEDEIDELMAKGQLFMARRENQAALAQFDAIVSRAPEFAEGWNKRATVYFLLGRYEDSVRDIQATLALEPRHFGALSGLGLIYLRMGNEKAALRAFEKALEVNPYLPGVRQNIETLTKKLGGKPI